jgi:hypothetical protein
MLGVSKGTDTIVFIRREAYDDSIANFGAVFAATQETMKSQAGSLVAIQNQLSNIQLCINVGQQPPSSGYVVSCLDMYRTKVLMYRTMVLLVRSAKVRR